MENDHRQRTHDYIRVFLSAIALSLLLGIAVPAAGVATGMVDILYANDRFGFHFSQGEGVFGWQDTGTCRNGSALWLNQPIYGDPRQSHIVQVSSPC